jgi:uncharacterized protein (TIGR03032 family)
MEKKYEIHYTQSLPELLNQLKSSILITTYQAGKLIAISEKNGEIHQLPVSFKKPMGVAIHGKKLAVACIDEIQFFSREVDDHVRSRNGLEDFDAIYLNRATYHTGIMDVHDMEFGGGMLWGVNTLFSCIGVYDINFSFRPKWKPPFISGLAPEDRCHLNGMAMETDMPKYVTALSADNIGQGWRKDKLRTGILMEVPSGDFILENLSMPHSPRIHDGSLYLLESGNGNLIKVDTEHKTKEVIFNFDCFVRGMAFIGDVVVIGKSKIRETSKDFNDLSVKENSKNAGVIFFDLAKRQVLGVINYDTSVEEIFDVQVLPDVLSPVLVSTQIDKFNDIITMPTGAFWKTEKEPEA